MSNVPNPPDVPTPPDETRHGPVPPMSPKPAPTTEPGRDPTPNREEVGDNPALPRERTPFPEPDEELPETEHPSSL
jgi:hypothetical protein